MIEIEPPLHDDDADRRLANMVGDESFRLDAHEISISAKMEMPSGSESDTMTVSHSPSR